ncbi:hypothetical protein ACNUDN_24330 [Mycobacterium sp. smrl_JER01]
MVMIIIPTMVMIVIIIPTMVMIVIIIPTMVMIVIVAVAVAVVLRNGIAACAGDCRAACDVIVAIAAGDGSRAGVGFAGVPAYRRLAPAAGWGTARTAGVDAACFVRGIGAARTQRDHRTLHTHQFDQRLPRRELAHSNKNTCRRMDFADHTTGRDICSREYSR